MEPGFESPFPFCSKCATWHVEGRHIDGQHTDQSERWYGYESLLTAQQNEHGVLVVSVYWAVA